MAEVAGPSTATMEESSKFNDENDNSGEPKPKKVKTNDDSSQSSFKLEERLNGILCCAVCLDLPPRAVYQCTNGHLMCASCLSHLLADARLKDESSTCPNCRCEISRTNCIRNLAVEKAISELPSQCKFCSQQLPRCNLELHVKEQCHERQVQCKFEILGCPWQGPFHEQVGHELECTHPHKSGLEVVSSLEARKEQDAAEFCLYKHIFNLLSYEKISFTDLQLRPYRTDDFITKLYYETSRFTAFNYQWVIKAHVNDNQKNPNLTLNRQLTYQLISKSKLTTPTNLHYIALTGPYGESKIRPSIYNFEFSADNQETPFRELPLTDYMECNKQIASKNINLRMILFQIPK